MNFRKLTSFWRRQPGKDNVALGSDKETNSYDCHGFDARMRGKNIISSFESGLVALDYIRDVVERGQTLSCTLNSSSDELKLEREEALVALEVCMVTWPRLVSASVERRGVDTKGSEGIPPVCADSTTSKAAKVADWKEAGLASHSGPSSTTGSVVTNKCSCDTTNAGAPFTEQEHRVLLYELVSIIFSIDRILYENKVEVEMHARRRSASVCTPLATATSRDIPDNVSLKNDTHGRDFDGDGEFHLPSLSTSFAERESTLDIMSHRSNLSQIDSDFQDPGSIKAEDVVAVAQLLTTWIVLRKVLCSQLELLQERRTRLVNPANAEGAATSGSGMDEASIYAVTVKWEQVLEELKEVLGTRSADIAEATVSNWILSNDMGHEFVQCLMQSPASCVNDVVYTAPIDTNCIPTVGTSDIDEEIQWLQQKEMVVDGTSRSHDMRDVVPDATVEEVEKTYEQCVVVPWVWYLEHSPNTCWTEGRYELNKLPTVSSACFCRMMYEYSVCSRYWNEERRGTSFSLLEKLWNEQDPSTLSERIEGADAKSQEVIGGSEEVLRPSNSTTPRSLDNGSCNALPPSQCTEVDECDPSVVEELMPQAMLQQAWATALFVRARQCLEDKRLPLFEAAKHVHHACSIPLLRFPLSQCLGAHEAIARAYVASGNYSCALDVGRANLSLVERECASQSYCLVSRVNYLKSLKLLAEIQAVHPRDTVFNDTAQAALHQASFCEQAVKDVLPAYVGSCPTRYSLVRREIYRAKLEVLKLSWRVHHQLAQVTDAKTYFRQYIHLLTCKRELRQLKEEYNAWRERGEQLLGVEYSLAVSFFKRAADCAKKLVSSGLQSSATTEPVTNNDSSSGVPAVSLGKEAAESLPHEIENNKVEAEGERNLALAYIEQADHEVNVKRRRQQLSNAVSCAYAAQGVLHRCTSKLKSAIPSTLMIGVASGVVVTAKALLRLGQPKKAALLLEPLIEEKSNSNSIRPPLWIDGLEPLDHPLTVNEVSERTETMLVRLKACDLHTQCLSKFDGERGCREVGSVRIFLKKLRTWATSIIVQYYNTESPAESAAKSEQRVPLYSIYNSLLGLLNEANALQPVLSVTCGDALTSQGRWEEALQEYSNALSIYGSSNEVDELYNCFAENIKECTLTKDDIVRMQETQRCEGQGRTQKYFKLRETLVLAKLAEVYAALEKPLTAVHYYHQVLEYSTEVGDALLHYNARLHLARLHTATGETEAAAEQWAQVSELAKVYDDEEISRETTRNIIESQRARGAYSDVIEVANELSSLASAAKGEDALEDRCFAMEAIADAHLQLGQYKECIKVLDEREKVEGKEGQRKGELFSMRARALLGDGATQEAVKVLMKWAQVARQQSKFVELANANAALAAAYAMTGQIFKAKRHHQAVLSAFAEVSDMTQEQRQVVMESARWLVHHFYLSREEVPLLNVHNMKGRGASSVANDVFPPPLQVMRKYDAVVPCVPAGTPSEETDGGREEEGVSGPFVMGESGDLSVLLQEEKKHVERRLGNHRVCHDTYNDSSTAVYADSSGEDGKAGPDGKCLSGYDDSDGTLLNCSMADTDMASLLKDGHRSTHNSSARLEANTSVRCDSEGVGAVRHQVSSPGLSVFSSFACASADNVVGGTAPVIAAARSPERAPESTLKEAGHDQSEGHNVERLADGSLPCRVVTCTNNDDVRIGAFTTRGFVKATSRELRTQTKVQTKCFHRALKTAEEAMQLTLMPIAARQALIPRNPADVVDLALIMFPRCTFVFYFADFATQHSVIVRPAGVSFYLECTVHPYTLSEYHSTRVLSKPQNQQGRQAAASEGRCYTPGRVSATPSDPSHGWVAEEGELVQSLNNLHAELWEPVSHLLETSCCSPDEAECLVLVVDPTLLQVPFPALVASGDGAAPLGQQYTMIVAPTVVNFLKTAQRGRRTTLFSVPRKDRCAFLPQGVLPQLWIAEVATTSGTQTRSHSLPTQSASSTQRSTMSGDCSAVIDTTTVSAPREVGGSPNDKYADADYKGSSSVITWTLFTGCTRKELVSAFTSSTCRVLMLLCDPSEHMFKVADGMVCLNDITRGNSSLPGTLDLVVVTNDRTMEATASEPGVAARLCLHYGCSRVLRVDLPSATSVTTPHLRLLHIYYEKLSMALEWRMRYPYSLALRMAQEEALHLGLPLNVCASLTLVGAA